MIPGMALAATRRRNRIGPWAAACGLALASLPAAALPPFPVGAEFQINTYVTGVQSWADVAFAPDGSFVVVWESVGSSGTDQSQESIHGQRYASNGKALGAEFQVNTFTLDGQFRPSVAVAD